MSQSEDEVESLDFETLLAVGNAFSTNGWNLAHDPRVDFHKVLRSVALLQADEAQLYIELLRDFRIFLLQDYDPLTSDLATALQVSVSQTGSRDVYILPIKSTRDDRKGVVKSGSITCYLLRVKLAAALPNCRVRAIDSVSSLAGQRLSGQPTTVMFVDDFIGSGDSALDCLQNFNQTAAVVGDQVLVASLVTMAMAAVRIQQAGVGMVSVVQLTRGISDSQKFVASPTAALGTMKAAEASLGVDSRYSLGYGGSEALVRMIRVPNNTFPVFWWESRTMQGWEPLFDRH